MGTSSAETTISTSLALSPRRHPFIATGRSEATAEQIHFDAIVVIASQVHLNRPCQCIDRIAEVLKLSGHALWLNIEVFVPAIGACPLISILQSNWTSGRVQADECLVKAWEDARTVVPSQRDASHARRSF